MYTSSCGDKKVSVVRRKRSVKVNRLIYFQVDLFVGTPVDELKGHCACYAEKVICFGYVRVYVAQ